MSSASRIGTPDESIVPSVRVKRATATLRSSGPMTGSLQDDRVDVSRRTLGERVRAWTNAMSAEHRRRR